MKEINNEKIFIICCILFIIIQGILSNSRDCNYKSRISKLENTITEYSNGERKSKDIIQQLEGNLESFKQRYGKLETLYKRAKDTITEQQRIVNARTENDRRIEESNSAISTGIAIIATRLTEGAINLSEFEKCIDRQRQDIAGLSETITEIEQNNSIKTE